MAKAIGMSTAGGCAGMDVPDRVAEALVLVLAGIGGEELRSSRRRRAG